MEKVILELDRMDAQNLFTLLSQMNHYVTGAILSQSDNSLSEEDVLFTHLSVGHTVIQLDKALNQKTK